MAPEPGRGPGAFWPALWLGLALVAAKVAHWSLPEPTGHALRDYAQDVAVSAHADVAFALGYGLLGALALRRARGRWRSAVFGCYVGLGAVCAVYAVASIRIFAYLRSPLTYPLLYLAGDMTNMRSSIGSFVDVPILVAGLAAPTLFVWLARRSAARPAPGVLRSIPGACLGLLVVLGYVAWGHAALNGAWGDRDDHLIAHSPHWEFLASCAGELLGVGSSRIDVPFTQADLADFERTGRGGPPPPPEGHPRNVVEVVLESTGTRYLGLYGAEFPTTPRLEAEARHGLVFDDFYCHVGLTANAMAALTLSIYPYMTWREYTVEYPDFPGRTLADLLKPRGYRTAFIHSGDVSYTNQRAFLGHRGFDVLLDMNALGAGRSHTSWGAEDRIVVDGLFDWLSQAPDRPFYALIWTIQAHHPYEPSPDQPFVDFFEGRKRPEDDYDLNRYLNTQREVDRQLGRLFDGLRERGLADDTLVIVTGDHGEAFGEPHRTWGHGARVYEENVHVPLLIWNPRLYPQGGRRATIGGQVDLNPTIAQLIGLAPDPDWEGHSLFDPRRPQRAYFYATNNDYLLGVRDGRFKYIYNATRGRDELYDLEADPDEQRNIAPDQAQRCHELRGRLAAWRDYAGRQLARARAVQRAAN